VDNAVFIEVVESHDNRKKKKLVHHFVEKNFDISALEDIVMYLTQLAGIASVVPYVASLQGHPLPGLLQLLVVTLKKNLLPLTGLAE